MESDSYLTIKEISEGLYKEKGSKFLAFAYPIDSENEAKEKITLLKKEYHDARHHCYAYIIGKDQEYVKANDDGEPNHSAGTPILGQIRSNNLSDILIVVVRYFGGKKLGVSGLINAYKTAAADAIDNNKIVEKIIQHLIKIEFDYLQTDQIMRLIKDYKLEIRDQQFDMSCSMSFFVRGRLIEELTTKLRKINGVSITGKL